MNQEGRITTERQGHVLLIGLDRVAKRNAFDRVIQQFLPDLQEIMQSEDIKEGILSFIERRPGNFKGR